ncbi:MAG: UDP-N-acetylmuramoyl-L-alanine--D-glutamate ligase [Patulibacter sp.]|nr:UDP-N-acetylmuramoyl-L-alanine--D-glutamate ligase [Patulibacter sp.]
MRSGPIPIPPSDLRTRDLAGRTVGIWGAGREAAAALRALRIHAPGSTAVVVTSTAPPSDAPPLPFPDVAWLYGDEGLDALAACDVVIRSPGVPVRSAEADRVRMGPARPAITTGTALWFAERVDRETVIGVTGTKGKSTTSSLIHHLLGRAGVRSRLVGNIGRPLLDELTPEDPPEAWVVELSSYQLSDLPRAPTIAVVTNLLRDHLPWHGDERTYHEDKLRILTAESGADPPPGRRANPRMAILSHADPRLRAAAETLTAPVLWVDDPQGLHVADGEIRNGGRTLARIADLPLRGVIGARNVCAALEVVHALGYEIPDVADALRDFAPLPHRQQVVSSHDGRIWVDDSISTTPEAALAAVAAFAPGPVVLIAGGDHRDQDYAALAHALATGEIPTGAIGEPPADVDVVGVVTLPGTGPEIAAAVEAVGDDLTRAVGAPTDAGRAHDTARPRVAVRRIDGQDPATVMRDAVAAARALAPEGATILLSPAAPSHNVFRDFEDRGDRFAAAAAGEASPAA